MEYETIIREQLKSMDMEELNDIASMSQETFPIIDEVSVEGIIDDLLNGQPIFDSDKILNNLFDLFIIEIRFKFILSE